MSHAPAVAETAWSMRELLRVANLPADILVNPAPGGTSVIDVQVPDELGVGRVVQVLGPGLAWDTGIIPGTFRADASTGAYDICVWCVSEAPATRDDITGAIR